MLRFRAPGSRNDKCKCEMTNDKCSLFTANCLLLPSFRPLTSLPVSSALAILHAFPFRAPIATSLIVTLSEARLLVFLKAVYMFELTKDQKTLDEQANSAKAARVDCRAWRRLSCWPA